MRLYSISDITSFVSEALRDKGFSMITHEGNGALIVRQESGVISQTFKIKVETEDRDPV